MILHVGATSVTTSGLRGSDTPSGRYAKRLMRHRRQEATSPAPGRLPRQCELGGAGLSPSLRPLFDRYQVGDTLGFGGMSEVHRGRDLRLGRDVAIKVLRADLARDPSFQARFRREAQNAASLNHPAIVAVYDTGETRRGRPVRTSSWSTSTATPCATC